ncbi:hypothetical protein BC834DRAFT_816960 [Gloeopeniophorella convolvens]|nr:hypothetical protein BC834DRAFT_816960 [Gloeopeniophorella convolvens]
MPPKIKPKRHHGFSVVLFILGTLFPPLAVAARFGIGSDFWLNLVLTLAGYFPGHIHNFYIQNIRNNKNHRRTPKWSQRYGLVDTSTIKRKEKRSQWAGRYDERLPHSALDDQPLEAGQEAGASSVSISSENAAATRRNNNGELWNPDEEQYYNQSNGSSEHNSSRWHYPANFDDASASPAPESGTLKKKKKAKKDRFARTEDAYSLSEEPTQRRKKKKRGANRSTLADDESTYSQRSGSTGQVPEDPEGGQYGEPARRTGNGTARANDNTNFDHQF